MASADAGAEERTEQPTARRREEARREGRVAKSPDLTAALLLLGALGLHSLAGARFMADAQEALRHGLEALAAARDLTVDGAIALGAGAIVTGLGLAWPFVAVPALVALAAQLLQTRFAFSLAALVPRWSRLDPLAGFRRLLGWHGAVELLRALLKLALVAAIAWAVLRRDWPLLLTLGGAGVESVVPALGRVVWSLWLAVGVAYLLFAGLDYGYQWWQHERRLRMTREEVREESRHTEGNPLLRGRIRSLHRQMARRRMMAEVKRADVVLRNPTHVAVALRYESGRMKAPKVVGKGARLLALRIIEVAARHGIPVVENPPLARALFRAVAVGQEIPQHLYRAVAEVLAYVYSLKGGRR